MPSFQSVPASVRDSALDECSWIKPNVSDQLLKTNKQHGKQIPSVLSFERPVRVERSFVNGASCCRLQDKRSFAFILAAPLLKMNIMQTGTHEHPKRMCGVNMGTVGCADPQIPSKRVSFPKIIPRRTLPGRLGLLPIARSGSEPDCWL